MPSMRKTTITTLLCASVPDVHYHPDGNAPLHILSSTEVIFCNWRQFDALVFWEVAQSTKSINTFTRKKMTGVGFEPTPRRTAEF